MSSQGGPASGRADGGWWDAVYEGPHDEVPDTPRADSAQGSVDDWFDSASGMIGDGGESGGAAPGRHASEPQPEGPPTLVDAPARGPVGPPRMPPIPPLAPQFRPPAFGVPQAAPADVPVPSDPGPPAERPPYRAPTYDSPPAYDGPTFGPPPVAAPVEPPSDARPPAPAEHGVPAPPPLPPLPIRPPRIPPQIGSRGGPSRSVPARAADPRVAAPTPGEPAGGRGDTDDHPADDYATDRYDTDSFDDEGYAEPLAVRDARADAAATEPDRATEPDDDRPVRGLDDVRDAHRTAAAAVADPAAAAPLPQVGAQPPAYEPEPTALPAADPDLLTGIVPDTALDGARYGTMTLRAASVRGDAARHHGAVRSDRLLTVRFGEGSEALLLVVLATPPSPDNPAPADEACRQLAAAVGRSRTELLADLRVGAQERLRYGLQRLTARAAVRLQNAPSPTGSGGRGDGGSLHALIAPLDPTSRLRAGFGLGPGGLLLLGDDAWYDAYAGRRLVAQQPGGGTTVVSADPNPLDRFRFRVVVPEPGDVLLLCSDGLAQPLREEPAVSDFLADHWAHPHPPGTVDFLRHVQVRAKGYAADRTAAAIWED